MYAYTILKKSFKKVIRVITEKKMLFGMNFGRKIVIQKRNRTWNSMSPSFNPKGDIASGAISREKNTHTRKFL